MKNKKNEEARKKTESLALVAELKRKNATAENEKGVAELEQLEQLDIVRTKKLWTYTKATVGILIVGAVVWAVYEYNNSEK